MSKWPYRSDKSAKEMPPFPEFSDDIAVLKISVNAPFEPDELSSLISSLERIYNILFLVDRIQRERLREDPEYLYRRSVGPMRMFAFGGPTSWFYLQEIDLVSRGVRPRVGLGPAGYQRLTIAAARFGSPGWFKGLGLERILNKGRDLGETVIDYEKETRDLKLKEQRHDLDAKRQDDELNLALKREELRQRRLENYERALNLGDHLTEDERGIIVAAVAEAIRPIEAVAENGAVKRFEVSKHDKLINPK